MNIFHRVTLATLRKNKVRTTVTIIGIILSAAMICAVTTFVSSFQNYMLQSAIYESGDWHGCAERIDFAALERIATSDRVEKAVYERYIGYAALDGPENEFKPYLYFMGVGQGYEDTVAVHLTAGEYPKTADEILLPEHLLSREARGYRIGQTLTVALGDRMLDGELLDQNVPCYDYDDEGDELLTGEEFVIRETRTFTVVGIYERPENESWRAPGYTILSIDDGSNRNGADYTAFFKMKNAKDVYDFMDAHHLSGSTNRHLLMYSGIFRYSSFNTFLFSIAAIVIGLIMFGSVSLIYNAFSISVSERTRQFGLLSSVGATRKQLRQAVLYEAFAVSIIGIPIGVLCGIGGIGVTLLIIGSKFTALVGTVIPMRLCVSPVSVLIATVVALTTVLISAWIPSRRATRVSAVEAIRQNGDVRMERHPRQTPGWIYKLFGLPVVLANKYYHRNRKKYRATVLSLFMSVVLFISASALSDYLMQSVGQGFSSDGFDVVLTIPGNRMEGKSATDLLAQLSARKSVTKATFTKDIYTSVYIPKSALSQAGLAELMTEGASDAVYEQRPNEMLIHVDVLFVNDVDFKTVLKENGLKEQDYFNADAPLAIALDGFTAFNNKTEKFEWMSITDSPTLELTAPVTKEVEGYTYDRRIWLDKEEGGYFYRYQSNTDPDDVLELSAEEALIDRTVRSGKTIYEHPYFWESTGRLGLMYPESMLEHVCPEWAAQKNDVNYRFCSDDHAATYNDLKVFTAENGIASNYLRDYAEIVEENRNVITIVQVFSGGFIVLISLIAAANVFNTISTNISLRRREFAMLKSVGMTRSGFNRMMNFECLLYGTRSLLFGLPVSVCVTFLIWRAVDNSVTLSFQLPWFAIGVAVMSVFAVVFVSMMYAMSKIKRDNPIDALKNENL